MTHDVPESIVKNEEYCIPEGFRRDSEVAALLSLFPDCISKTATPVEYLSYLSADMDCQEIQSSPEPGTF